MFCKVCGNKMGNGERFCRKCGSNREIESEIYNYQPRMESGNGLATAGMVIGIIVTIIFSFELFGFILLNALEGISTSEPKYAIYAALLFELVPLITALIGVILSGPTVCTLETNFVFDNTPIASGTGYIYVSDNLVDTYKAATNWSAYASQIVAISE